MRLNLRIRVYVFGGHESADLANGDQEMGGSPPTAAMSSAASAVLNDVELFGDGDGDQPMRENIEEPIENAMGISVEKVGLTNC